MILVMSGTADGREIVRRLHEAGTKVLTTVATSYGEEIFRETGLGHLCIRGRLDGDALLKFIDDKKVDTIIDATHPYAANASLNAMRACTTKNIKYIRFQREATPLPESPLIHEVGNIDEAVGAAGKLGRRILLTTGFNSVKDFIGLQEDGSHEIIARILPMPEHVNRCIEMGISPNDIIAAQGPFSKESNVANIRDFDINVVVTKDGGREAKTQEKIDACLELEIPMVIIHRPRLDYPVVYSSIDELVKEISL